MRYEYTQENQKQLMNWLLMDRGKNGKKILCIEECGINSPALTLCYGKLYILFLFKS